MLALVLWTRPEVHRAENAMGIEVQPRHYVWDTSELPFQSAVYLLISGLAAADIELNCWNYY